MFALRPVTERRFIDFRVAFQFSSRTLDFSFTFRFSCRKERFCEHIPKNTRVQAATALARKAERRVGDFKP